MHAEVLDAVIKLVTNGHYSTMLYRGIAHDCAVSSLHGFSSCLSYLADNAFNDTKVICEFLVKRKKYISPDTTKSLPARFPSIRNAVDFLVSHEADRELLLNEAMQKCDDHKDWVTFYPLHDLAENQIYRTYVVNSMSDKIKMSGSTPSELYELDSTISYSRSRSNPK